MIGSDKSRDGCFLMRSSHYAVVASIGTAPKEMIPHKTVVDTGSGYNVIRRDSLPPLWRHFRVTDVDAPKLADANGNPLPVQYTVRLRIRFGNALYTVDFHVVDRLTVPVLIGTQFLDAHCEAIRCRKRLFQLTRATVPIIGYGDARQQYSDARTEAEGRQYLNKKMSRPDRDDSRTLTQLKLARALEIPAYTQAKATVSTKMDGLVLIEPKNSLHDRYRIRVANGVHDVPAERPFEVLVSNFGPVARLLPKGTVIGYVSRSPLAMVTIEGPMARHLCSVLNIPVMTPDGPTPNPADGDADKQAAQGERSENLAQQPVATEQGPANTGRLTERADQEGTKLDAGMQEDWRDTIDLSGIKDDALRKRALEMFERHVGMWSGTLGQIKATEHRIVVPPGTAPIRQQPYRAGPKNRQVVAEHLQTQLDAGVIEPACSEWASPVVLVLKKDGSVRFCVDFRRLNAVTIADTYPLPRMEDCIDSLGEARVFSTLDALWGYWQVPIAEEDRDKTTFTTHLGTYRYIRMPFGLRNAPATFQRALDIILSGVRWRTCLVYLDDVVVFSKDQESHLEHLDDVLALLEEAGIKLKLKKCFFFKSEIEYLGHVLMPGRLGISQHAKATKAVRDALFPRTPTQLRSFLGAANVYRRFVRNFSRIARPLSDMLAKNSGADLQNPTKEQEAAFKKLKDALSTPPVLALPKANRPYMIDTDASKGALGAVLLQQQDDSRPTEWATVGYYSRTLTKEERNYSPTERECLAVVWAVTTLRPYVEGSHFTLRTDHNALRWMLTLNDPQGRLMRWRLRLMEYDYSIEYRPGRVHQVPDALSRLDQPDEGDPEPIDDDFPTYEDALPTTNREGVLVVTRSGAQQDKADKGLSRSERNDSAVVRPLVRPNRSHRADGLTRWDASSFLPLPGEDAKEDEEDVFVDVRSWEANNMGMPINNKDTEPDLPSPVTRQEVIDEQRADDFCQTVLANLTDKHDSPFFEAVDGVLCRRDPRAADLVQIVLPATLQARVLRLAHYSELAGHPGQSRLHRRLRQTFYWPHMAADVATTVRNCPSCAKNRLRLLKRTGLMKLFPALKPLESVAIDILGPLPKGAGGFMYLLVIVDRFTKLTQVVPLRRITAYDVAVGFVNEWVFKYGPPQSLLSDNGSQFVAHFFQKVCQLLGINSAFTTAYHPQSNGQVERFNRTITAMLRCYVEDHPADWAKYVPSLCYAYNTSVHRSTGTTPFDLVLSRAPPDFVVSHNLRRKEPPTVAERNDYVQRLESAIGKAKVSLKKTQERYKKDFDARVRRRRPICVGDAVYLDVHDGLDKRPKLSHEAEGPYRVLAAKQRTATIQRGNVTEVVSLDRVTPAPKHLLPPTSSHDATPSQVAEKVSDGDTWLFEKILDHRKTPEGEDEFLMEWTGNWEPDWQPRAYIPEEAISRFFATRKRPVMKQLRG